MKVKQVSLLKRMSKQVNYNEPELENVSVNNFKPNLKMTLEELNLRNGQELSVTDVTNPSPLTFKLHYKTDEK